MKRIMFKDRYGLTQAVLDGRKTMTRRFVTMTLHKMNGEKMEPVVPDNMFIKDGIAYFCLGNLAHKVPKENQPAYKVGEEVAVAQKYKDCWDIYQERWEAKKDSSDWHTPDAILGDQADKVKGWTNKMFVRADLMPYRIRITNIKVERLQDISEEDCLREGIKKMEEGMPYRFDEDNGKIHLSADLRMLFADLIDRISGRGTWNRNPWVFAYEFELLR